LYDRGKGGVTVSDPCPIRKIIKRNGTIVKYNRQRIADAILKGLEAIGRADPTLAAQTAQKVEEALVNTYSASATPSVEDIQDIVERVLMENRLTKVARSYIIYRHQRAMERSARVYDFELTDNIPYKKIYQVLLWNTDHGCESVPSINRLVSRGGLPDLVTACERRYSDEIGLAASALLSRLDDVRVIIVAGPSSSGKTTTMIKLSEKLKKAGVRFKAINIDHYFFNLEEHPVDEFGDYDYETPQSLDLELINEHLERLLDGDTVKTPDYDFRTGTRTLNVHTMKLAKKELLLIDSLHGLYGAMTESVPAAQKFKLYIETLGQLKGEDGSLMRWADNRLLRRMIRDRDHRNLKPIQTLTHWHYVRKSELRNIIPFIGTTDCVINSALPYEIPVLKHRLFRYISAAVRRYKDDASRLDAQIRARRVYGLLKPLKPVKDDSCVPEDSLIREFIGGSKYKY